ncbi:GNAT family N-acetyltransferase [Mucilaginibacter sp. SP1R1]|uniref:GNAT family N-acetyltransferase n=1 Tax=Mucilaginibacter sp. SP1R1 TaxID=2723091 RepID=UPI00160BA2E4|nr:GNAT family N-acetyltransferase [Mucilaginibacter sp. SP1R1]MBB6151426.1 ribosomal protein S18 acetylase RimI-like enzyme [Mucilaginibacter sp. SP1R1]
MPITKATLADIPELNILINSAYRGEESKKGWTTEADLIEGIRIDEEMLTEYLHDETISILKYTDESGQITGSVYLEVKGPKLYLGMFSVAPVLQGKGVGRALLQQAEVIARQLNCHTITMTVIRTRTELISWYERRGYTFTGEIQPFHSNGRFGDPKQLIELIVMEKTI